MIKNETILSSSLFNILDDIEGKSLQKAYSGEESVESFVKIYNVLMEVKRRISNENRNIG